MFQSPPASKGGCNGKIRQILCNLLQFQSPPASKGGCNICRALTKSHLGLFVSIPTRLERRVQLPSNVLPVLENDSFNPHPPRKAGAMWPFCADDAVCVFQSPPASKGGCNISAIIYIRVIWRFNPHPPRKAGAMIDFLVDRRLHDRFQSPPASKGGCNHTDLDEQVQRHEFQSPPASKGGCNRDKWVNVNHTVWFQSPPASKGGCNVVCMRY